MTLKAQGSLPHPVMTPVDFDPFAEVVEPPQFPLTEGQREIWASVQMGREASCAYNQCFPLRLRGPFSVAAMRDALRQLVARHEALRLTCEAQGEYQSITPLLTVETPLVDVSMKAAELRAQELAAILRKETEEPFDLVHGPLVRARIIKEADDGHVVILTAHHIVCDGWSAGILLRDLAALYESARYGLGAQLPTAARFSAYARRQAGQEHSSQRTVDEQYWKAQFQGPPPALDLPTDRSRPPIKTYSSAQQRINIDAALYRELKRLGAKQHCTLYAVLLACYQALLHRLTGQTDLVVGIPVAGQATADESNLVGHCTNLLPLRCQIDREAAFLQHLLMAKRILMDALEHQTLSFGSLVRALNLPRDPSRTPLVTVIFNVDRAEAPPLPQSVTVETLPSPKQFATFELELNILDTGSELVVECNHNADLFTPETVRRWLGHYRVLLEGAVTDPSRPIQALPLLKEAERRQLLVEWNDTKMALPGGQGLHQLVETQAERTPHSLAVVAGSERITYRDLNRRANRVSHYLRHLGVGPEVLVGLCTERSIDMIVGALAILKAGGAYVPLDPAYPRERLAFVLEDSRAKVLLTQRQLLDLLPEHTATNVCLDDGGLSTQQSEENLTWQNGSHSLAYVIYTSGSTGKPKGVAIEHHSVTAFVHWARTVFPPEDLAGVLASTSVCFDLSVFEMFVPLSWGGCVILADNALQLPELPAAQEVTLINTVPSAIAQLLRMGGIPQSVRAINLAGEPLSTRLVNQMYGLGTVQKVFDLYGPSETTTYSTYTLRRANEPATIGRPLANTEIYLLDACLQPVPVGVAGELFIGGQGLARGYLHRPELTREKFIPHSFSGEPDARLYRTGDLARYRPDGNIEFLGRMDHQVKLRGFRIELGEIESVLAALPGVRESVVVVREDRAEDKRLVAYVVPKPGSSLTVRDLRNHVREQLPDYMMPTAFLLLEAMPLTPNGKVDRKALPAPEQSRTVIEAEFVAPRTPTEETLAELWGGVLGLERVGIYDNFFELGGHSILAAQLLSRLHATFGVAPPLRNLFRAPTVAEFAGMIEALLWTKETPRAVAEAHDRVEVDL